MTEAHITVQDKEKRMATIIVQGCKDSTSAQAIADFINTHSAAGVLQWKFIEGDMYESTPASGKYNSIDQQNLLLFTDAEGFSVRFSLPAPDESTLSAAQETTADFAGLVSALLHQHTSLPELAYNNGGLTAQIDIP